MHHLAIEPKTEKSCCSENLFAGTIKLDSLRKYANVYKQYVCHGEKSSEACSDLVITLDLLIT